MDKNTILENINTFIENKKDNESKVNKYYYIESEEAIQKAGFVNYIIENNQFIKDKFSTIKNILDLSFGSGNLTTHIILDNSISYDEIVLNDKYIEDCNVDLENFIDNCQVQSNNFFNGEDFIENSVDMLIFNPTHGGKPSKKDYVAKENQNFEALNLTLKKILKENSIVIFRGSEDDFNQLYFSNFTYQQILIDNDYLFISYDINEIKQECYEYKDNKFIKNKLCKKTIEKNEDCSSISDIINEINFENIDEQSDGIFNSNKKIKDTFPSDMKYEMMSNIKKGKLNFPHKNILFKGVPGTGKSKTVDNIIKDEDKLDMQELSENILRINIHSASSNSDLMQGISISTDENQNILYKEKRGSILKHIIKAIYRPYQPFVLVLEEIQENSLNELIGDLIYLIEDTKRTEVRLDEQTLSYDELIEQVKPEHFVELPSLVENNDTNIKMTIPDNLYIFCTSNYRDDKKVIEDNLLRRFDVIEMYPKNQEELGKEDEEFIFKSKEVSDFLEKLNKEILTAFSDETHSDRNIIGHANWLNISDEDNVENRQLFYKALLKVVIEFKEIREVEFESFVQPIFSEVFKKENGLSATIEKYLEIFYTDSQLTLSTYKEIVEKLQKEIYSSFI